jgi:hypothetical protein
MGMKKQLYRVILSFFAGFVYYSVHAQVVMQLQVPPTGIMQKNQLWNMVIVNASGELINVQAEMNIYDARTTARVLSAVSTVVPVAPGSKQLSLQAFSPVQYQYLNPMYQVDAAQNGLLPVGIYKVCYSLLNVSGRSIAPLTEECREIEVMPVSPVLLAAPVDSAMLKEKYPQFNWIPPAPLQAFKSLSYEIRVVALQPGQNSSEAIQQNLPVAVKANLREPFFAYPSSLPAFDTSSLYAWQITAFDANGYSVKSEVWVFSLEKNKYATLKISTAYIQLTKGSDPSIFISNGKIKFMYENLVQDSLCTYQLVSVTEKEERVMKKGKLSLSYGENFMTLDLTDRRFWREGELYRFELLNSKGEKWMLTVLFIDKEEEQ